MKALISKLEHSKQEPEGKYSQKLHCEVNKRLALIISKENLFLKTFSHLDFSDLQVLDILFKPQLSIDSLALQLSSSPNIAKEILDLINHPAYRNDRKEIIQINTAKHACIYFGINAIRILTPYILKRSFLRSPKHALNEIKPHFWQESLRIGQLSVEIAEANYIQNYHINYTATTMINLAKFLLIEAYYKLFESLQEAYIQQARQKFNVALLNEMLVAKPYSEHIIDCTLKHWPQVFSLIETEADFKHICVKPYIQLTKDENQNEPYGWFWQAYYLSVINSIKRKGMIDEYDQERFKELALIDTDAFEQLKPVKLSLKQFINKEKDNIKLSQLLKASNQESNRQC